MDASDLSARLSSTPTPTIKHLGGASVIESVGRMCTHDTYADRLVFAIVHAPEISQEMAAVAIDVVEKNPIPAVVAAALSEMQTISFLPDVENRLQQVLLARIALRAKPLDAEMASECLAGAFRLASAGRVSRLTFLGRLDETRQGEHAVYARRAAVIAGLSWLWDRSPYVQTVLERLVTDDEVTDQALYELALIQLDTALDAESPDSVLDGLASTAELFQHAFDHNEDFIQAQGMAAALRAVVLFCRCAAAPTVERELRLAQAAFQERMHCLDRARVRTWLRTRIDAEISWYELSLALEGLAEAMNERSWLRAVPTLERIAAARRAMISVASEDGDALRQAVTDRFARSFLAREGLRAHLEAWSRDASTSDQDREHAQALLQAIPVLEEAQRGKPRGQRKQ
ncbi:MAG TPA: hypothetical protein VJ577_16875 [Burkholderiaceae bacterium]|nr:hypothetical protein [Burkholderiaceae bacterium]